MTKQIPLTQGKFALVDDDDYERVSQHRWCAKKDHKTHYATRCVYLPGKETTQSLHRFILNAPPKTQIDHINGNGLDCRKENLRYCNHQQNCVNRFGLSKKHYKGIRKSKNRWTASICVMGRQMYLGSFASQELAARVYDRAARKYFGEFAKTNFLT